MAKYRHFGVPTSTPQPNESYMAGPKLHLTDPEAHPYKIEFLRFDADSDFSEYVRTRPHVAFEVESLDAALQGQKVVVPAFDASPTLRCAFILDGEALIELMECK